MSRVGTTIVNPRTGQRMEFLQTGAETGGRLLQIACRHAPRSPQEPEHVHPHQTNRFVVRTGTLHFCVNGRETTIGPEQEIVIPPGTPHYFWNPADEEAHYLQEFSPALRIDVLFETAFALAQHGRLNAKGMPNLLQLAVLIDSFRDELQVLHPPQIVQKFVAWALAPIGRWCGYRDEYSFYP